jgi:hypothetical protein
MAMELWLSNNQIFLIFLSNKEMWLPACLCPGQRLEIVVF